MSTKTVACINSRRIGSALKEKMDTFKGCLLIPLHV